MNTKPGDNGGAHVPGNEFNGEKVKYPVNFELKVIMDISSPDETNKSAIMDALAEIDVPCEFKGQKGSSTGKYISYTIQVNIADEELMKKMYARLREIPGIKMAL